jgi:CDP-glycerol glycerophosphotransferase (TagB/SpsB family)
LNASSDFCKVIRGSHIVLCSLPPDYYPCKDFKNYNHMIESWVEILAKPNVSLILSLHPRTQYSNVQYLEREGVKIIKKPIEELIPLCDVFVACISATIRYALTNKKIILNYDVFQMNYSEYTEIESVRTVNKKEDFIEEYNLILKGFYRVKVNSYYNSNTDYFGRIGENIMKEIHNVFERLCKKR